MTTVTEASEQEAVIQYCQLCGIDVVHIPNEGKRSKYTGAELKRLGLQKGFPDLFFPYARGEYHGLVIEMKRDHKSRVSSEQTEWIAKLNNRGYFATVCYGADNAINTIRWYLNGKIKG